MADLTHIFKIGQKVKCNMDGEIFDGVVKETFEDHIIVDISEISDHCWFEEGVNMDCVYLNFDEYVWMRGIDSDFEQEIRKALKELAKKYPEQWEKLIIEEEPLCK